MSEYDLKQGGAFCPIFPKKGPRAVVLCDGPPPPEALLVYWLNGAELFLCADGAGYPYNELPRIPDIVIGDFDSLAGRILDGKDGPTLLRVDDQYTTDSEKALLFLAERGIGEVVLIGATGGRIDHTLYNCSLLERFAEQMEICIVGPETDTVRLGPESHTSWPLAAGTNFSIMPLAGPVTGVTLEGAEFPLLNDTLAIGGPATVSNSISLSPLLLSVKSGSMLVSVDRYFRQLTPDDNFGDG